MRCRRLALAIGILGLSAAPVAVAGDMSAEARAIFEKRSRMMREVRVPLTKQIEQRRAALAAEADMADVRFHLDKAEKDYEAAKATGEEIKAARDAQSAAEKALPQAIKNNLEQNPRIQTIRRELAELKDETSRLRDEERKIKEFLSKLRNEMDDSPEVVAAKEAIQQAEKDYKDLPDTHPKFVAARRTVADAQKALAEAIKNLPESRALREARQAYETLRYKGPEIAQAKEAVSKAKEAYTEALARAVKSSPDGSQASQRLEEINELEMAAEAVSYGLSEELEDVERDVYKTDPNIAEVRQTVEAARAKFRETMQRKAGAELKTLETARRAYEQRLQKKLASDPMLLNIQDRLEKANKEIDDLYQQYRQLREKKN